jgi:hypothetical protein
MMRLFAEKGWLTVEVALQSLWFKLKMGSIDGWLMWYPASRDSGAVWKVLLFFPVGFRDK